MAKYENAITGKILKDKPEHMTALVGNKLVNKNHARINLRGMIDELEAKLLLVMLEARDAQNMGLLKDLKESYDWVKALQYSEITDKPMKSLTFDNLDYDQIREHSHYPKKIYGIEHLFGIDYNVDAFILKVNQLRAYTRRCELVAVDAYIVDDNVTRGDILIAFNRLSSVFYIIELKIMAGKY